MGSSIKYPRSEDPSHLLPLISPWRKRGGQEPSAQVMGRHCNRPGGKDCVMFLQKLPGNLRRIHRNDMDVPEFDASNLSVEVSHKAEYPPECRSFDDQFRQITDQRPWIWPWREACGLGFEFIEDEIS